MTSLPWTCKNAVHCSIQEFFTVSEFINHWLYKQCPIFHSLSRGMATECFILAGPRFGFSLVSGAWTLSPACDYFRIFLHCNGPEPVSSLFLLYSPVEIPVLPEPTFGTRFSPWNSRYQRMAMKTQSGQCWIPSFVLTFCVKPINR